MVAHGITAEEFVNSVLAAWSSDQLKHGDVLTRNEVGNLAITRRGDYIGYFDLHTGEVELED